MIGPLERVPLREVWKHEVLGFTWWLQDTIDVFNQVLDFSLSNTEWEQPAGMFSVDLIAENETRNLLEKALKPYNAKLRI